MQRRTLIALGLAGTAALGAAGGAAWLLGAPPAWRGGALQAPGLRVMRAVARAALDGSLPADATRQTEALDAHLERLGATIAAFPAASQAEVDQLLTLLALAPGRIGLARLSDDWPQASVPAVQGALQSMRTSRFALRRQAYHALRDLTHAAYYIDPSTWATMGYPGPRTTP
jgi:hypothetical protein